MLDKLKQRLTGQEPGAPYSRSLLAVLFGLLVLCAIASILMALRLSADRGWVEHTFTVRETAQNLLGALQDAEVGQRGYIITEDARFLAPYTATAASIPVQIETLKRFVADNPTQSAILEEIQTTVSKRLELLDRNIDLVRTGKRAEAVASIKSGNGFEVMQSLRAKIGQFMKGELGLLHLRQADADRTSRWLLAGILLTLAFTVVLGALMTASSKRYLARITAQSRELKEEIALRKTTEETLRQTQKMEAIGQLSGGIAHDFNNLLTIVLGNIDTAQRRLRTATTPEAIAALPGVLAKPLDHAKAGGDKAAQLTQRLLAFSRRQPLSPARTDINKLVSGMSDLFQRTLSENVNIETVLAGGLWKTFVDPNQLENALLNLAVNARDAMPDGGRLTIETGNTYLDQNYADRFGDVRAGQYVCLTVTDTGTGIPPEVLARIFEPFFTTKEHGKGTGLGLPMVHGFVKQSGGHIRIYSENGEGTTVKIYLPRDLTADQQETAPSTSGRTASGLRSKGGEVILVVEDNEGVRSYAVQMLAELGYSVIAASDMQTALTATEGKSRLDLLFTDVVLPGGSNGKVIAKVFQGRFPGLPVLYTTGYTRNAIVHQGRLDPDVHLLNKPYTQLELARAIRELLDSAPSA